MTKTCQRHPPCDRPATYRQQWPGEERVTLLCEFHAVGDIEYMRAHCQGKRNPIIEKIGPDPDDEVCRLVHACRMVARLEKAVAVEFETDGPDEKRAQELADAKAAIIAALVSGRMP